MKIVKKLEDYDYKQIIDMKREQFEEALSVSSMNIGQTENMRKFFSLQHDIMRQQVLALSKLLSSTEEKLDDETRSKAEDTIAQLFLIMFSLEYKATLLFNRTRELSGGLNN